MSGTPEETRGGVNDRTANMSTGRKLDGKETESTADFIEGDRARALAVQTVVAKIKGIVHHVRNRTIAVDDMTIEW